MPDQRCTYVYPRGFAYRAREIEPGDLCDRIEDHTFHDMSRCDYANPERCHSQGGIHHPFTTESVVAPTTTPCAFVYPEGLGPPQSGRVCGEPQASDFHDPTACSVQLSPRCIATGGLHHQYVASTVAENVPFEPEPSQWGCSIPDCADCENARESLRAAEQRAMEREASARRQLEEARRRASQERRQLRSAIDSHLAEIRSDEDGQTRVGTPGNGCQCEACKYSRGVESKLTNALIESAYSAPPMGWMPRGLGTYWLGVELETDMSPRTSVVGISNSIAASMGRPEDGFWFPKSDGSVTGPEFCSHPATMGIWHGYEGELREMFQMLVHSGYRSHNGGRAGMHVSFSKSALDDPRHLYRLLGLIHRSPNWSLTMSQRNRGEADQWASLDMYRTSDARKRYLELARRGIELPNRYAALNHPGGSHANGRFEFRLPRGTLRIDRFLKNLEWTAGMIEYTREVRDTTASSPVAFMKWVGDQDSDSYPNLWNFIQEKGLLSKRLNRP